jgi:hypothetical protein
MKKEKKCSIEGCPRPFLSKGYCKVHYNQLARKKKPSSGTPCETEGCNGTAYKFKLCNPCRIRLNIKIDEAPLIKLTPIEDNLNEVKLILTKWKRGYIDELLYFRTINLYLNIFDYNREIEKNSNPNDLIVYILKELKGNIESKTHL